MGGFWGGLILFVVGGVGGMCFVRVLVPLCVVWVHACVCVGGGGDVGGDVGRCAGVLVWLRRVASGGV